MYTGNQEKLINGNGFINYGGVLVEKLVGGYRVFDRVCNTPDEVDAIIQQACSSLSESLVVKNNGNWSTINSVEE